MTVDTQQLRDIEALMPNGGLISNTIADIRAICKQAADHIDALRKQVEELRTEGAAAVRWAPSSAHWSCELKRLFGDDARQGIDALERRLRDAQAENDALREALEWYAGMAKRMGNAALHGDSQSILALMKEVAVDYGGRARAALNPPAPPQGDGA